ncbi:MAG TPA: dihydropteroate synthase [Candidatus Brachybacterium merdavium]|uniref:Dihydropteroate synthase n=1 Tax=Candidatus Brachybacterium merdavium TaxID=2838513 RepID=A0A9D2LBW7_9MICO|nr:dihydropteroate synthase [Candidatus Brachybacterium merdavium]
MDQAHDDGPTARLPVADSTVSVSPEAAPRFSPGAGPEDSPQASPNPSPQANPQPSLAPRPLPDTARRVLVMAIVNRTRDSFFDEGRTWDLDAAVLAGREAAADGADIIDVGGVKFAPGEPLPVAEEIDRVIPVIRALREQLPGDVLLSVDTFHAAVAQAAIEVGVDLINDTTGLSDPEMAPTVAAGGASIVLTHSLAEPRRQYLRPQYDDVVEEVRDYLASRLEQAVEAGVARDRIVLDPGPDLNKSSVQTLAMMREWEEYTSLGLPVLGALSRKDVIGESLGLSKQDRLEGSLAAAAWVLNKGARILRVHDVSETVRMVRMLEVLAGWREPAGPLVHNA